MAKRLLGRQESERLAQYSAQAWTPQLGRELLEDKETAEALFCAGSLMFRKVLDLPSPKGPPLHMFLEGEDPGGWLDFLAQASPGGAGELRDVIAGASFPEHCAKQAYYYGAALAQAARPMEAAQAVADCGILGWADQALLLSQSPGCPLTEELAWEFVRKMPESVKSLAAFVAGKAVSEPMEHDALFMKALPLALAGLDKAGLDNALLALICGAGRASGMAAVKLAQGACAALELGADPRRLDLVDSPVAVLNGHCKAKRDPGEEEKQALAHLMTALFAAGAQPDDLRPRLMPEKMLASFLAPAYEAAALRASAPESGAKSAKPKGV